LIHSFERITARHHPRIISGTCRRPSTMCFQ
jgi:hypothetical protein